MMYLNIIKGTRRGRAYIIDRHEVWDRRPRRLGIPEGDKRAKELVVESVNIVSEVDRRRDLIYRLLCITIQPHG